MEIIKKGFTLVELLVVVAILGILAAVGIVSFGGFTGSAKESAAKANYNNFISEVSSLLMKCHLGEEKVYLKVVEEGLPYAYDCNTNLGNFLILYQRHLNEYKKYRNPYRTDQPALLYGEPQDTLQGRLGVVNMWLLADGAPHNPMQVSVEYAEGKVLKSTISVCLQGGCGYTD